MPEVTLRNSVALDQAGVDDADVDAAAADAKDDAGVDAGVDAGDVAPGNAPGVDCDLQPGLLALFNV